MNFKYILKCDTEYMDREMRCCPENLLFDSKERAIGWLACHAIKHGARRSKKYIMERLTYEGWKVIKVAVTTKGKAEYINLDDYCPFGR